MIYIDYHPGRYGHFLEYIVNIYIMKTLASQVDIFTELGTSHNADKIYRQHKIAWANHYSWKNNGMIAHSSPNNHDQVIRIVADENNDEQFFISLYNFTFRAGDTNHDSVPAEITSNRLLHRNFWYTKIVDRWDYPEITRIFIPYKNWTNSFPYIIPITNML